MSTQYVTGRQSPTSEVIVIGSDGSSGSGALEATQQDVLSALQDATFTAGPQAGSASLSVVPNTDTAFPIVGSVAHDAVDSGNPAKIGGKAVSALSAITLVASADRVDGAFDLDGAFIVRPGGCIGDRVSGNASNTDGTSTQCIAAQAAGIKVMLTDVTLTNTSSTNTYCEIKDGATAKWTFPLPANGGVTHRFETPLSGTAATAWNFDPGTAATTVYCSMAGRLSKV